MLTDLKVTNFALIDKLEISFNEGLNVLTGETGAGKSILIGALDMLLGARASSDVVRKGADKAYIEAIYEPGRLELINNKLVESGIETDSGILLLSREIKREGPNRSRINGQLATLGMVRNISRYLVDIHGQHEHQSLLDENIHLELLDDFLGSEITALKDSVQTFYNNIKNLVNKVNELALDEGEKERQLDMLNFQIEEIEQADLSSGEVEKLEEQHRKLNNMEDIFSVTGKLYNEITGEDYNSAVILDRLGDLMGQLETVKDYDTPLEDFYDRLSNIFYRLQDLVFDINSYHQNLEFDQHELDKINERIAVINKLKRKYGSTVDEIIDYKDKMIEKRDNLNSLAEKRQELNREINELRKKYNKNATKLSRLRKKKARELEKKVVRELKDLAMEDTLFKVNFAEKSAGPDGIDEVKFLIRPNPGGDLKPLSRIASGGELSRIMLALKSIITDIDRVDTVIFDEVDKGVSGKIAQKMAEKLVKISKNKQVICITHLPQIASMADYHYYITKQKGDKQTFTEINKLAGEDKRKELARLLGGVKMTETTLRHAEEMLKMAARKKETVRS